MCQNISKEMIESISSTSQSKDFVKKIIGQNSDKTALIQIFAEYVENDNEFTRIFAILGLSEILKYNSKEFEYVWNSLVNMYEDRSKKVITYGLIPAFTKLFEVENNLVCEKFSNKVFLLETPILYRAYLESYSKYIVQAKKLELTTQLYDEITSIIGNDDMDIQQGLVCAINNLGNKNINLTLEYIEKWIESKNINTFWVIKEVLDRKFGKNIPVETKNSFLKKMELCEKERNIFITEKFNTDEMKEKVVYQEKIVRTLLHPINVFNLPFSWGANPYRGCYHACEYCYGRTSHEYLGHTKEEFERVIYVKTNAATAVEKDISTAKWKAKRNKLVNLGTVTDPYQRIDEKYELSRQILEVFYKHQNPITVTTKSDLIVRDIDILKKLGKLTNVVISLPSLNQNFLDQIERRATPVEKRLEAIEQLKKAGVTVGVLIIPILPFINDDKTELEHLVSVLASYKVDYAIPDIMNIRGDTKYRVPIFLDKYYPHLKSKYEQLYCYGKNNEYADKAYMKSIFDFMMKDCLKKYGLNDYSKMIKGKWD